MQHPAQSADTCQIVYRDAGGISKLNAYLVPAAARAGTYSFKVTSTSLAGTSTSQQSGAFSAAGGQKQSLSEASVNGGPQNWVVELQVYDSAGKLLCRSSAPDKG